MAGPYTWAHSQTSEQVPRPCLHPGASHWTPCLVPVPVPPPVPISAPQLVRALQAASWEPQGHPRCHRATPRLTIPVHGGQHPSLQHPHPTEAWGICPGPHPWGRGSAVQGNPAPSPSILSSPLPLFLILSPRP